MATSSDNPDTAIKLMEQHLSCNICYNLLREPKDLDCPHMFCLQCLQKWVKKDDVVECPECRRVTILPQGGLVNLKTNLRLKNMIEEYSKSVETQKTVSLCSYHVGEKQHFFCVTCGVAVCRDCLVLKHERPKHEIKEMKEFIKMQKMEVECKLNQVKEEIQKMKGERKELDWAEKKIDAALDKAVTQIELQTQFIISAAEAKKMDRIERVKTACDEHMKVLHEKQNHIEDRLTKLQEIHAATRDVVDTASDPVHMKQHMSLIDQMDKLCITEQETTAQDVESLVFKPSSDPTNLSWFGDAMLYGKKICALTLVTEFGPFHQALGVAVTCTGLLAVVDAVAALVFLFHEVNGEYEPELCLGSCISALYCPEGLITNPYEVAATPEGKFFVTHGGRIVKIYEPSGEYEKTLTDVDDNITAAPNGLIVTANDATGDIAVHQSDGELIRKLKVECKPMQSIASNGKQIAYTGFEFGNAERGKVCVLDIVTGEVVWTVDMASPLGICYESSADSLFDGAGHIGQGAIYQLCSKTGRLISRLATGLFTPITMTVTHDSKLVVADYRSVKVYAIH